MRLPGEITATLGKCETCGAPMIVWSVVTMSPDGVEETTGNGYCGCEDN